MLSRHDFNTKEQKMANRLIDYYEGKQLCYVKKILNGEDEFSPGGERHDWQERGVIARVRNVFKSITDKSGLLFNKPPKLSIKDERENEVTDETLNMLLEQADWVEFFQNVDVYTRFLKATVVLAQRFIPNEVPTRQGMYRFNPNNGEGLVLHLLHPGNCAIEKDQLGSITELAYKIDVPEDLYKGDQECWAYRKITPESITDYVVYGTGIEAKEVEIHNEVNVDGIVPAVVFYDTKKPYGKCFPHLPEDLMSLQELYNLHLSDLEFAIAWQKHKTLFVDRAIMGDDGSSMPKGYGTSQGIGPSAGDQEYSDIEDYPTQTPSGSMGGLGSVVQLEAGGEGQSAPMVKFDGPESDLQMLQDVVESLVKQVAHDWDVNVKTDGSGSANSGFQLVVEEINNLNLREKRKHFFVSGLRQLYQILQVLYPELTTGQLHVEFNKAQLPVNQKEQEELWDVKIDGGRASTVDYFMKEEGLSYEDALQRALKVIQDQKQLNDISDPVPSFVDDIDE